MQVRCNRKEAIDLPQVHAALHQPIDRPLRLNVSLPSLMRIRNLGDC
jgi:hypothetical protein